MKFNFKKIASVLTSTVMLSSTIAFAAAATFPEPFVEDGAGNYAIVVGADGTDSNAATQLNSFLNGLVTENDDDTTPISVEGAFLIADGDDKFNLGSTAADVMDEITDDELPELLATIDYTNSEGDDFEYDQVLTLSDNLLVNLTTDSDDNTYIGMNLADGDLVFNYTLTFDTDAEGGTADAGDEYPDFSDTYITMLGKEYYISDVESTADGIQMTLLDSANKVSLNKGELQTITVGDQSYDVELTYVHSTNGIKLNVEGADTGLLDEGDTKKLSGGLYLTVLENLAGEDADADSAVISIGTGEIVLTEGEEVEINGEILSDVDAYEDQVVIPTFGNTSTDLSSISFGWELGDDVELKSGDELVLPGFETVKVVMGDFKVMTEEVVSFNVDSTDVVTVTVPLEDEDYELPILWSNGSSYRAVGSDDDQLLRTSASTVLTFTDSNDEFNNDYFVVTRYSGDESESYVLALDDIDDTDADANSTTLVDLVSGDSLDAADIGDTIDVGDDITIKVLAANEEDHSVSLNVTSANSYWNKIVTAEGLTLTLPVDSAATAANNFSAAGVSTWAMTLTEETGEDDGKGTIAGGDSFTVTLGFNTDDEVEIDGTSLTETPETDGSDTEIAYLESELATKVALDTGADQQTLEVTYHGGEAYAEVYVAAGDAVAAGGGVVSGSMVVTDTSTEFDAVKTKNLIVLGGTCVNKVAAKLLNVETQYPVCGTAWESLTQIGAGEFLVQTVTSPYSADSVAMLVAGYSQVDTANAASALEASDDVLAENGKKYVNSGTTLTAG